MHPQTPGRAGGSTDQQVWTFLRMPGCFCGTVLRAPKTPHIAEPPTGERSWHLEAHWVMICPMAHLRVRSDFAGSQQSEV